MSRATNTRERILDAAQQLVLQHGFAATTVDAVLATAGASKGAFFHHFPSKAALGRALVQRYAAADVAALDASLAAVAESTDDPAEQLVELLREFERAADAVLESQPSCLFVSFIYETELAGSDTGELIAGAISHWHERILDLLTRAAGVRRLPPAVDLPSLADQVFTVFEGGFLLARALDDRHRLRRQLAHLRHYLELLFGFPVTPPPVPRQAPAPAAGGHGGPATTVLSARS